MYDTHKEKEDYELYTRVRNGDKQAFNFLFKKYYPVLCTYGKQFVNIADSEEVVQDVMVWLWENRKSHTINLSLRHYLFRAVKNNCIHLVNKDLMRQNVHHLLYEKMQPMFEDPDFYIVDELTIKLENALKELPETYRQAFEMNRFQNKTYNDIAEELNISRKTVDYRIQQALKALRIKLKDYLPLLMWL